MKEKKFPIDSMTTPLPLDAEDHEKNIVRHPTVNGDSPEKAPETTKAAPKKRSLPSTPIQLEATIERRMEAMTERQRQIVVHWFLNTYTAPPEA